MYSLKLIRYSALEWDHYNLLQIKTLSPFAFLQCQSLAYSKMRVILQIFITAYYTESLHPQISRFTVPGAHVHWVGSTQFNCYPDVAGLAIFIPTNHDA